MTTVRNVLHDRQDLAIQKGVIVLRHDDMEDIMLMPGQSVEVPDNIADRLVQVHGSGLMIVSKEQLEAEAMMKKIKEEKTKELVEVTVTNTTEEVTIPVVTESVEPKKRKRRTKAELKQANEASSK